MENETIRNCHSPLNILNGGTFNEKEFERVCNECGEWADEANEKKDKYCEPLWKWDCQFKLDFDGPIIGMNSRFYYNYKTDNWSGNISVMIRDNDIKVIKIKAKNLDKLKDKVEEKEYQIRKKYLKAIENIKL